MPPSTLPPHAQKIYLAAEESALKGTCKGDKGCAARVAWGAVKKGYKKVGNTWEKKSLPEVMTDQPQVSHDFNRRYTKQEVAYQTNIGGDMICGNCAYFHGPNSCSLVDGPIDPNDTCILYSQMLARGDMSSAEARSEFEMVITKASFDEESNEHRWAAVASDTDKDKYNEQMSLALFSDFIERIDRGEQPPAVVTSSAWMGGLPYLGLSHYMDYDGYGIVGDTIAIYKDGNRLKAKGLFKDTPLGLAAFEAIRSDMDSEVAPDHRIRISIAFIDWGHSHGDFDFERRSLEDRCPMCDAGVGDKIYKKGQLIHLALTRVPVNERTPIWVEERSMTTRREDAVSVLGEDHEDLVDELEARAQAHPVQRSEAVDESAVVIKGDSEDAVVEFSDYDAVYIEKRKFTADKRKQLAKEGKAMKDGSFPIENCGDVSNALKRIGTTKHSKSAVKAHIRKRAKALGCKLTPAIKSELDGVEDKSDWQPLGGATSLADAEEFLVQQEKVYEVMDTFSMLSTVLSNIYNADSDTVPDKPAAIQTAVSQFKERVDTAVKRSLAVRAATMILNDSEGEPDMAEETPNAGDAVQDAPVKPDEHIMTPVDKALANLKSAVDKAASSDLSVEERGKLVQPALDAAADVIKAQIVGPEAMQSAAVADAVAAALGPTLKQLTDTLGILAAKSSSVEHPTVPAPRGIQPHLVPQNDEEKKASPITKMVRRSVGLQD